MFKVIFLSAIVFLVLFFLPSNLKAAFTGAPFLPTPKRVIKKALQVACLKAGETLFDLGSGTGKALVLGEKEFGAKGIGLAKLVLSSGPSASKIRDILSLLSVLLLA